MVFMSDTHRTRTGAFRELLLKSQVRRACIRIRCRVAVKIRQHVKIVGQAVLVSIIADTDCPLPVVGGGHNPVDMPLGNGNLSFDPREERRIKKPRRPDDGAGCCRTT